MDGVLYANVSSASGHGVYRSDDGGSSWRPVSNPSPSEPMPLFALTVLPRSPRTVYAATLDGTIYKTTDGGAHWTAKASPDGETFTLAADAGGTVYAGLLLRGTNTGGVLRSIDGGAMWTQLHRGIPGLEAVSVAVDPANPDVLITSVFGPGLFRSATGGGRWIRTAAGLPLTFEQEGVAMAQVLATAPGTFYAVETGGGRGWRTTNGGLTWSPLPGLPGQVHAMEADPLDPGALYAVTEMDAEPALYRSGDGGATWARLSALPPSCRINGLTVDHATASAPAVIYVAGARPTGAVCRTINRTAVFRSPDGGATWTLADAGLTGEAVQEVVVDRQDPRVLYAGMAFGSAGLPYGMWKSTDSGASWQALGLGGQVITALAGSPLPGRLWAATRKGRVFRSDDAGASWRNWSGGQTLQILDFTFDPLDPHRVYAAGSGGVWRLDDAP